MMRHNIFTLNTLRGHFNFASLAVLACVAILSLSSCNVEEFPHPVGPEQPKMVNFRLNLEYITEMPIYKDITITRDGGYDLRYQINAYRMKEDGSYDYSEPSNSFVYFNSDIDRMDRTCDIELPEGTYQFYVFTDYVASNHTDLFYNTSNFNGISLTTPHVGSNDYRDCFRGMVEADVVQDGEATVEDTRPVGKYLLISEDAKEFITRMIERYSLRGEQVDPDAVNDITKFDLNDFTVNVIYQMYMPSEFNMFSNRAVDSSVGVRYTSKMQVINADEVSLAFDYVFCNTSETRVNIVIQVTENATGEVVSTTPSIEVPMMRSQLTVIRGDFLTSESSAGIGIDPSFDGEFNIEIL